MEPSPTPKPTVDELRVLLAELGNVWQARETEADMCEVAVNGQIIGLFVGRVGWICCLKMATIDVGTDLLKATGSA